jgi:hypothetical protein
MSDAYLERARAEGRAEGLRLAASLIGGGELLKEAAGILVALAEEECETWRGLTESSLVSSEPGDAVGRDAATPGTD